MTLWKITLGEVRRRPGRAALGFASVAIGVATVVSIALTVQATRHAHREMFEAAAGRAALEVVAEGFGGFDESLAAELGSVTGIEAAVPIIQTPAALIGASGTVPVLALGIDPQHDAVVRDYSLRQGRFLDGGDGVLLEARFAESLGLGLGDEARFASFTGTAALTVVGLLEARGAATFNSGAVAFLPLRTAQRIFGLAGRINAVQLVLVDHAVAGDVEAAVRGRLPTGFEVQPPAARAAQARDSLLSIEQGLSTLSAVSLVAGAFVVTNAFLMNLGERRRQLAILRAVGATRLQVTHLLVREALMTGTAGAVAGIGLGWALAIGLRAVMSQLMGRVTLSPLHWTPGTLLVAVIAGPAMAIAATYVPARRAGRRAPLQDLLDRSGSRPDDAQRSPGYVGLALLTLGAILICGFLRRWFSPSLSLALLGLTNAICLVGAVLAVTLILPWLIKLSALVLEPLLGVECRLAIRQLDRHRGRTALTSGVLFVAIVFAIGFGNALLSNIRDMHDWLERVADVDFYIRAVWPDPTTLVTVAPLPETLADDIRAFDGVERVDKFNWIPARAGGRPVLALARTYGLDPSAAPAEGSRRQGPGVPLALDLAEGEPNAVLRGLLAGDVVLGTTLAQRLELAAGDEITIESRQGPQPLRIAGTATEWTVGGMAIHMDWSTAKRLFEVNGVHNFLIKAKRDASPSLADELKAFSKQHGLLFQSYADLRVAFDRQMQGFLDSIWVMMSLVFVVASLGIVNTLTMNVLEQTRELGVLRALGMKRAQVGKMIISQALALGVISLVPGTVVGIGLALLMNISTYPLIGVPIDLHIDVPLVIGCFWTALAIGVAAALLPAWRAARLHVIRAIQYE